MGRRASGEAQSARHYRLKSKFGISEFQYNVLNDAQNGVCAVCYQKCRTGRSLSVDHCHETGAVRGLLCTRCNMGIGYFDDDPNLLLQAARYLRVTKKAPEYRDRGFFDSLSASPPDER